MSLESRIMALPRWAFPVVGGSGAALAYWLYRKGHTPAPAAVPVAAVQPTNPTDNLPAYVGGTADYGNSNYVDLHPITDALAQLQAQNQAGQTSFEAALAAIAAAEQSGFEQLAGLLNARPPVTGPSAPTQPTSVTPTPAPTPTPPTTQLPGGQPITSPGQPVLGPPPVPPAPPPTPVNTAPPVTAPPPAPPQVPAFGAADWAAFSYFLAGKGLTLGGLHYAGEPVQIRWREAPWNSGEPGPPSGQYPIVPLPVNYNGNHDNARYPYIKGFESALFRTLRWTSDYMAAAIQRGQNPNPQVVWDGELGRLMRDIGRINGNNWYDTGFDLGSVRNSPFLDGDGTPNPAWQNIY